MADRTWAINRALAQSPLPSSGVQVIVEVGEVVVVRPAVGKLQGQVEMTFTTFGGLRTVLTKGAVCGSTVTDLAWAVRKAITTKEAAPHA